MSRVTYDFAGRVALVTGSSRGIGRVTATLLADAGADVVVHYRRDEDAARAAVADVERRGRRACLACADLASADAVEAMMDRVAREVGHLDLLIANAAATAFKPMTGLKPHNVSVPVLRRCTLARGADDRRRRRADTRLARRGCPKGDDLRQGAGTGSRTEVSHGARR